MNKQKLIEKRIYYLHQYIIQRLKDSPEAVINKAKANLTRYRECNGDWNAYQYWDNKLQLPVKEIINILNSSSEEAILARSNSPFAGCIPNKVRWEIIKQCNQEHAKNEAA